MTDSTEARSILRNYFSEVSDEEYIEHLRERNPELLEEGNVSEDPELAQLGLPGLETQALVRLALRPDPVRYPLDAYLACALTALTPEQRQLMVHLSDAAAQVCKEMDINLYEPRMKTDPVHHPSVSDAEVFHTDRERVIRSDLIVYLAHYPSTGAGEELMIAYDAMVPIIVVSHTTSRLSRMVTGIPGMIITVAYEEPEEMRASLRAALAQIRPQLVQRKLAFGEHDVNIVGDRIRRLRENQGLTRADVAAASSERFPINEEMLARIEHSSDRDANLSLIHLREISTALRVTVADLVEPNMEENILSTISSWISGQRAARFGSVSNRDRNRLLRRLLLRLVDSLEDE